MIALVLNKGNPDVGPVKQNCVTLTGFIVVETCTNGKKLVRQPLTTFRNIVQRCTIPLPKR